MNVGQADFLTAVLDPERPVPKGLLDGAGAQAGRRFGVYRNNVAVSLTEALHQAFPVVARLLGKENMDGLAGMFLRRHPPSSPLLMLYGAEFADFLAGMEQLAHLGYLADVARLEQALRLAYHAADADPVRTETLAAIAPESLAGAVLSFAPAMQLVRSPWPIFDIWRFNTEPGAPKPRAIPQDVLITRADYDPVPHPLPPGGADWVAALSRGETTGDAFDAVRRMLPDFDPAPVLAILLQGGAITDVNPRG